MSLDVHNHSWAYDFSGRLIATPHVGGLNIHESEKFDKTKSNLKEVRSKVWMDIIFVISIQMKLI